jgi:hypothetical protein
VPRCEEKESAGLFPSSTDKDRASPEKEKLKMKKQFTMLALVVLMLTSVSAIAATSAANASSISPTLVVNVNVQKAVRLTLATGTMCTVSPGSDYSIDFGTVDALGISNPTCAASKYAPTTPGTTPAVYYTDYKITPVFTGQGGTSGTVTAYVSSTFTNTDLSVVQANSTPSAITDLAAMSTNPASPTSVATGAASGTALTRYIGVSVAPGNTAAGSDSATITYTLTVP